MLRRLKHWLLGHDFYTAYVTCSSFDTHIAFVCKCGATKRIKVDGRLSLSAVVNSATDSELDQLKKMAGLS